MTQMVVPIDILVTLNQHYLKPVSVMLVSLFEHNPQQRFRIWLIHEAIPKPDLQQLQALIAHYQQEFTAIKVDGEQWRQAPTEGRYPIEMYFRLLCGELLPQSLSRVLYLDPDILVLNSVLPLWQLDLETSTFAAATHTGMTNLVTDLNKLRLGTDHAYFNSGVMLIDLARARQLVHFADIQQVLETKSDYLLLPDQDLLNYLYGREIKEIPEEIWNYDARKYAVYFTRSLGKNDLHWIIGQTVFLHFCGQPKPWDERHDNRFTALYGNYQRLTERLLARLA
ncbi:glycosyltransferase family 8 protein [Lapidilactobacillus gannanensis]|jgi:lipopolysaccharide biosynthesis glycosyltransferase|uniref:Glycosyltransferase family 8 protein n=1 Tax=Lapidilactobacillus gannanensis TaxID=2486002 RepID=A0ABW4BLZ8_9LACO|nr:glycosyltransferase family 8 protein [Lapidilactobacillus gannanensis]MCH4056595.1 glycosyltransferase family 8 protein [Lactobacillaceae bacterium]